MLITKEFLRSLDPCTDGYKWWCEKYGESVELPEFVKAADEEWDYVRWLSVRCLTHKSQVMFAVWCAERVVHLYNGSSDAPQKAIDAAKKWIEDPSEENRLVADAAAYSAHTAADAADASYAAYSGYAAAHAAYSAYSADAAAHAADTASYAADYAADYAAADAEKCKKAAMAYLLTLETK